MIPLLPLQEILHIFTIFVRYISRRHQRIISRDITDHIEVINLVQVWSLFIQDCLKYIQMILQFRNLSQRRKKWRLSKPHVLISLLRGYRSTVQNTDVWMNLETNWSHFFWLTGETPDTLAILVNRIEDKFVNYSNYGPKSCLNLRNKILLCMIWLRRYPTMHTLSMIFGIHVSSVHKIIHKYIRILHVYLVPKYIRWHSMKTWRSMAGTFPDWPSVVAIIDGTPFRISKPKGAIQRLFYRPDRHCFFLNWIVIIDALGYVVYSRPGFIGRVHDNTCMSNSNMPVLPNGLQMIADQGFEHAPPILVLPHANQQQVPAILRQSFRTRRALIERCFGILKNSYTAVGTRRFRSHRWHGPLICNLTAALYNRRKRIFQQMRIASGHVYRN